jgi:transcriptional regulator with XRE-family HTH domain
MKPTKGDALRREEIRRFLMARRALITPDSVGCPGGASRRTPGLRREEVASLAGIGVTWYTWFEQGRGIQVSARVLERIARALQLTPSDTDYLFSLCGIPRGKFEAIDSEEVEPYIHDTLDAFRGGPAFFGPPCGDVLAYNRLGNLVFDFDGASGPFGRNHYWRLFMEPKRRTKYLEWEKLTEIAVPWMRSLHGKMPDNAYFNSLIRALYDGSKEFKRLWDAQATAPPLGSLKIAMKLPQFGAVSFTSVRLRMLNSEHVLMLLPPADEKTASVMRKLSAATGDHAQRSRRQAG